MPDFIITYETLYELLRREKYKKELQELNKTFFNDTIKYLNEKQAMLDESQKKESVFAASEISNIKRQLQNVRNILKELYDRRENKIIQEALFSSRSKEKKDFSAMLPEEIKFYKSIKSTLNFYRNGILFSLLSNKFPVLEKPKVIKSDKIKENGTKLVRFLHPVPKFVGDDLNIYGPFEEEDMSNLPTKTAEILIKNKRTEEINLK